MFGGIIHDASPKLISKFSLKVNLEVISGMSPKLTPKVNYSHKEMAIFGKFNLTDPELDLTLTLHDLTFPDFLGFLP
jgi:hypothetical protein